MAKFNESTNTRTKNIAGAVAYARTNNKQELITMVISNMLQNTFYGDETAILEKIESLCNPMWKKEDDVKFIMKLVVYTRTEMNLRSISHYLAVLLIENVKGLEETRKVLEAILIRPDDATEIVALWNQRNTGSMIPNSLRRAIKTRLENKWKAYHLKKYYGNGKVKVPDLIKLCHPKPQYHEVIETFKQALEGTLPNIDTAQTVNAGNTGEERLEAYHKMLSKDSLGIMAGMKNLVNILSEYKTNCKVSVETSNMLAQLISDPEKIDKGRLLPFRYVQAYEVLRDSSVDMYLVKRFQEILEMGFNYACANIDLVEEKERVAILLDDSASMGNSAPSPFYHGKILTAALLNNLNRNNVVGMLWATEARVISMGGSPLLWANNLTARGGGTNLAAPMSLLTGSKTHVDKIIIFTDMQVNQMSSGWQSHGKSVAQMVTEYRTVNPNVKILFWNLASYGGAAPISMNQAGVMEVAGYSDKLLGIVAKVWDNPNAMIDKVNAIKL